MRAILIVILLFAGSAWAQSPYQPSGASASSTPTFTWPATGANQYTFYLEQYGPDRVIPLTPQQAGCDSQICTYSPGITLVAGRIAAWWIEPDNAPSSGEHMFYVPIPGPEGWPANISDKFSDVPCTKWYQVTDFPGQTRRVIDFNTSNGLGQQAFHKDLWIPVDISDVVPSNALAARLLMETIYSASCAGNQYCSIIGFSTRRHGAQQFVNGILHYTTAARLGPLEITVLLNQGIFDFYWSDVANNINVAQVDNATVTGEMISATIVEYCTP